MPAILVLVAPLNDLEASLAFVIVRSSAQTFGQRIWTAFGSFGALWQTRLQQAQKSAPRTPGCQLRFLQDDLIAHQALFLPNFPVVHRAVRHLHGTYSEKISVLHLVIGLLCGGRASLLTICCQNLTLRI